MKTKTDAMKALAGLDWSYEDIVRVLGIEPEPIKMGFSPAPDLLIKARGINLPDRPWAHVEKHISDLEKTAFETRQQTDSSDTCQKGIPVRPWRSGLGDC